MSSVLVMNMRRSAWGHGYATEGAQALIAMGFTDLGVRRVFAHAMAGYGQEPDQAGRS